MKVKPALQGLSAHRYKENPLELAFAEEWSRLAEIGTMNYVLAKNGNNEKEPIPVDEAKAANTVIQWLGSPVGQAFLLDVLKRKEAKPFLEYLIGDKDFKDTINRIMK